MWQVTKGRTPRRLVVACAWIVAVGLTGAAWGHAGHHGDPVSGAAVAEQGGGVLRAFFGWFDNYGNYMPRIHCLRHADGTPDWPWISLTLVLNAGVVVGYAKIYRFWRRTYLAEAPRDRNRKLMDLARIFLWCAVCGYGFAIVMFWWPAYRAVAIAMGVLNFFTWRFAGNLNEFGVSLRAVRLQRELKESFEMRAAELERVVAERTAELEQARAAAIAADEAKTNFLANMSHEIRTPMTAILGFTQILAERQVDEAARLRYTHIVRQNGQHLLNIINDVLDMARIEAGQISIERVECDLPALLRDVEQLWTPKAAEKSLTMSLHVAAGVPVRVRTDPTRLRQVLFNLVGNAIKFTETGGVTIVARPDKGDPSHTVLEVVDTGIGMGPEQTARLFERFMQADTTTTRRFGGSGLGLVIARHLTTLLGGTIEVRSAPGLGSRFTVTLPLEAIDAARTNGAAPADAHHEMPGLAAIEPIPHYEPTLPLTGKSVLIVDDQEDNRGLVRFMLERAGATVEEATDGREAIDLIRAASGRFAVVLMDMHMPRLDGYAATTTLRHEGATVPIIAVTANSMAGDRERCLAAGCDEYVTKPVDGDELISIVVSLSQRTPVEVAIEVEPATQDVAVGSDATV